MSSSYGRFNTKSQKHELRKKEALKTERPKWDLVHKLYAVYDSVMKYRKSHLKHDLSEVIKCAPDCPAKSSSISDHCTCGMVAMRDALEAMEEHHKKHGRIDFGPTT